MDKIYKITVNGKQMFLPKRNEVMPSNHKYTKENPYISTGLSRETKAGKKYYGFEGDVAEFNDKYMKDFHYNDFSVNKMGLGIDEVVSATINFSRKNYADHFPENPFPKDVKLVGNTVKSKKMPTYISNFLTVGVRLLLNNKGQDFIEYYYEYVSKIYNYKIPLRDIATKGKIKKSIDEYLKDIKQITKAGRPKSRQAWYELAMKNNVDIHNGDTIYYVNTGTKKADSDVKKVVEFFKKDMFGEANITKELTKEYNKYRKPLKDKGEDYIGTINEWVKVTYPEVEERERIILNCEMVPIEVIDSDEDVFCSEDIEYNVAKYVEMFNKRITPLLVCFSKDIRDTILVSNPADRKYFTKEQSALVSGEPNNIGDQDTFEQLMTMEDKEIKFWKKYNMVPPFLEECNMGKWEDILMDYDARMEKEKELGIDKEREYIENALSKLTMSMLNEFVNEGVIPDKLLTVGTFNPIDFTLVSKKYNDVVLLNLNDLIAMHKDGIAFEEDNERCDDEN